MVKGSYWIIRVDRAGQFVLGWGETKNREFATLGQRKEERAEGKLIKGHQREMARGRDKIKECRPFVPCRPISAPPEPALRSQDHCTAQAHG